MVKNIIKAGNIEGKVVTDLFGRSNAPLEAVNRSVIIPSAEEQNSNPRSRSAKLRVAKKKEQ
jgi:16S rRNA (cytosine1402-N4)-methyltransferase